MRAQRDLPLPLYAMVETRELFVFDHVQRTLGVVVWTNIPDGLDSRMLAERFHAAHEAARRAYLRWAERGGSWTPASAETEHERETPTTVALFTPEAFQDAVREAQDYIAAGHTYQVNLSLRHSRPALADPVAIYESLRHVSPSPYMGLLRLPGMALVCGSPELLVKLVDRRIVSRPIAGTRRRGADEDGDECLAAELVANEKERAEHLMLVDLIRNDLGRVAEHGSVHVREFMGSSVTRM